MDKKNDDEMVACEVRIDPEDDGYYVTFRGADEEAVVGPFSDFEDAKALFDATLEQKQSVTIKGVEYALRVN